LFVNDIDKNLFTNASIDRDNYFKLIDYLHEKQIFIDNSILQAKKTDVFNCITPLISYFSSINSISYIDCCIMEDTFSEIELKCNYNDNYNLKIITNKQKYMQKRDFKIYKSFINFINTNKNFMKFGIIKSNGIFIVEEFENYLNFVNINDKDNYIDNEKDPIIQKQAETIDELKQEIELLKIKMEEQRKLYMG
jgi:hypothetical protein